MIRSIILVLVGGLFLLQAVRSLRAMRLKEQYALLFIFVAIPFLLLAIWPRGIELAAAWLNIDYQSVMILALGLFLLIVIFKLTSIISVQERRIGALTQHVAILMEKQDLIDRQLDTIEESVAHSGSSAGALAEKHVTPAAGAAPPPASAGE